MPWKTTVPCRGGWAEAWREDDAAGPRDPDTPPGPLALRSAGQPRMSGQRWTVAPTIEPMDYQLVIKIWRKSLSDETFLATLEAELGKALGDTVALEGYDTSPKEINLFMSTADPRQSFRRSRDVLERLGVEKGISAAYRLQGGAKFTSVWPLRATRKFALP